MQFYFLEILVFTFFVFFTFVLVPTVREIASARSLLLRSGGTKKRTGKIIFVFISPFIHVETVVYSYPKLSRSVNRYC